MSTTTQECCVCYSTTEDIEPVMKNSFIVIPCSGQHVMCFSCFMLNANAKCPMCRFNYKTMSDAAAEPNYLPVRQQYHIEQNQAEQNQAEQNEAEQNGDIAFIDGWWIRLRHRIPELIVAIRSEVYDKLLNNQELSVINFTWTEDAILENAYKADHLIDLDDHYDMCCRMYLTKMLSAFNEIDGEDHNEFVESVNDFIQHEHDNFL